MPGRYIGRSLLSYLAGMEDRTMRSTIEWARRDGWPILSRPTAPAGGYRAAGRQRASSAYDSTIWDAGNVPTAGMMRLQAAGDVDAAHPRRAGRRYGGLLVRSSATGCGDDRLSRITRDAGHDAMPLIGSLSRDALKAITGCDVRSRQRSNV